MNATIATETPQPGSLHPIVRRLVEIQNRLEVEGNHFEKLVIAMTALEQLSRSNDAYSHRYVRETASAALVKIGADHWNFNVRPAKSPND
jgi:phytoene/squalene synthetase